MKRTQQNVRIIVLSASFSFEGESRTIHHLVRARTLLLSLRRDQASRLQEVFIYIAPPSEQLHERKPV